MGVLRVTARVVPVNEDGAALLLLDQDPAQPGDLRWVTIGGAIDEGETWRVAAVRELFEETGIVATAEELTEPFHRVQRAYTYDGVDYDGDHTYVGLALPRDVSVSFEHLEPEEIGNVLDAAWFTPQSLAADGRMVEPDLPDIITSAIRAVRGDL